MNDRYWPKADAIFSRFSEVRMSAFGKSGHSRINALVMPESLNTQMNRNERPRGAVFLCKAPG